MKQNLQIMFFLLVAIALTGCGRTGYLLRSDAPLPVGTVIRVTDEYLMDNAAVTYPYGIVSIQGRMTIQRTHAFEAEILSLQNVRINTITHAYKVIMAIFDDEAKEETQYSPIHGVAVLGTKEGDKWVYTLEEGIPNPEQEKELMVWEKGLRMWENNSESKALMYPDHRVNVGDRWDIDSHAIRQWMKGSDVFRTAAIGSDAVLKHSGSGTMEFRAITTHEDRKCAHLIINLQYSETALDDDNNETTTEISMRAEIYRALDVLFDMQVDINGQIKISSEIKDSRTKNNMIMAGPVIIKSRVEFD